MDCKLPKSFFDQICDLCIDYSTNTHTGSKFITDFIFNDYNKDYINLDHMIQFPSFRDIVKRMDFTKEQFDMIRNINYLDKRLIFNPRNAVYLPIDELFCFDRDQIGKALNYIEINDEIAVKIYRRNLKLSANLLRKDPILKLMKLEKLVFNFTKFWPHTIILELLDEILSRDLTNKQKFKIATHMNFTDMQVNDFIIANKEKFNKDILAFYSARTGQFIVDKNTYVSDYFLTSCIRDNQYKEDFLLVFMEFNFHKSGLTKALHTAIHCREISIVKKLIEKGAICEAIVEGYTALQKAALMRGKQGKQIFEYMMTLNLDKTYRMNTLSFCAKHLYDDNSNKIYPSMKIGNWKNNGKCDILTKVALLESRNTLSDQQVSDISVLDINEKTENALLFFINFTNCLHINGFNKPANKVNDQKTMQELIEKFLPKASVKFRNVYAILHDKPEMIEADEDLTDLLFIAVKKSGFETVKKMIEKGAKINEVEGYVNLFSPSLEAIRQYKSDILKLFIDNGLNTNEVYASDDFTLINAAIQFRSYECFNLLLPVCDLVHRVTKSPMECAIREYLNGYKYFALTLLDKIDPEIELIENNHFAQFLQHLDDGKLFGIPHQLNEPEKFSGTKVTRECAQTYLVNLIRDAVSNKHLLDLRKTPQLNRLDLSLKSFWGPK